MSKRVFLTSLVIVSMLLGISGVAQTSGTWTSTASMSTARYAFTAVVLKDGRVLVAGGIGTAAVLGSAELYDPQTGIWSPAANMKMARAYYVATLLKNGRVLIAGGCTNSNCSAATATAEIYDPATNTWRGAGRMSTLRYFFAATALANGTVLVEGGCNKINCTTVTTSAELYDPRTGQWTLTAPMKTGRDYHTASLVNGKVLVSGGYTIAGASTSVEMYDPATATWSTMGSMISGRALHSATTLFDGRVLVAGGLVGYLPSDLSETYDPVANKWSLTSNLTVKRAGPQLVLLPNHTALAAGGYSYTRPYYFNLASCELFDSVAGTWTLTADMTTPRYLNALAMLNNGQVLAVGGISSSSVVLSTAELYMP